MHIFEAYNISEKYKMLNCLTTPFMIWNDYISYYIFLYFDSNNDCYIEKKSMKV